MTTDFRALCAKLVEDFDDLREVSEGVAGFHLNGDLAPWDELSESGKCPWLSAFDRARTQLAQPEGEGSHHITPDDFRRWWRETGSASPAPSPEMLVTANAWAQYCLDRWGRPIPQPPAEGEVVELVEWLGNPMFVRYALAASDSASRRLIRAAELLQRQHPQPVPVAERLPGPEDCDAQGRCWLLTVEDEYPQWRLHSIEGAQPGGAMIWVPVDSSPGVMVDCFYTSHWLPFHALPLPTSEETSR